MAKRLQPKTRAIRKLEELGWVVSDVERRIPGTRITKDAFGVIDLLALKGPHILGLQVTGLGQGKSANGNVAAHVKKMLAEPRLWDCLTAGMIVEVWGIRSKEVADGSWAIVRSFQLEGGDVSVFDDSSVLPGVPK